MPAAPPPKPPAIVIPHRAEPSARVPEIEAHGPNTSVFMTREFIDQQKALYDSGKIAIEENEEALEGLDAVMRKRKARRLRNSRPPTATHRRPTDSFKLDELDQSGA